MTIQAVGNPDLVISIYMLQGALFAAVVLYYFKV